MNLNISSSCKIIPLQHALVVDVLLLKVNFYYQFNDNCVKVYHIEKWGLMETKEMETELETETETETETEITCTAYNNNNYINP